MNNTITLPGLAPDILFVIFELNALTLLDDDALKATRMCSQVCKTWRDVILNSPSVWRKLINLDVLDKGSNDWRVEVLNRTANAPLWIKAVTPMYDKERWVKGSDGIHKLRKEPTPMPAFFFFLLQNHWDRIEKLVARADIPTIEAQSWRAIYLPAPRLRVFKLSVDYQKVQTNSTLPLFANHAPLLTDFHAENMTSRQLASSAWISNLRSIHIGWPFTLSEILKILSGTPLLEALHVRGMVESDDISTIPSFCLPNLNQISLFGRSFLAYKTLVSMFCIHSSSISLSISLGNYRTTSDPFSKILEGCFRTHQPSAINLMVSGDSFRFRSQAAADNSTFSFTSPSRNLRFLFLEFCQPAFALNVTELDFGCANASCIHYGFHPFLRSLPSVKILHTDERTLQYITSVLENIPETMLPMLRRLKLKTCTQVSGRIMRFLQARIDARCPISVLDLTECFIERMPPAIQVLEKINGLSVYWRRRGQDEISYYECGSGKPETLCFLPAPTPND